MREKPVVTKEATANVLAEEEDEPVKAASILPAKKRSCREQSADKENDGERPSKKRFGGEKHDTPLLAPSMKSKPAAAVDPAEECCTETLMTTTNKASKRSRKRLSLSRSSTIDNSDLHIMRPMKALKQQQQQSAAIETWKLNTIKSRQRNNDQQQQAMAKGHGNNTNLLSNFVTYADQLPPTPNGRRYERVSSLQTPSSLGGGQRPRSAINDNVLDHEDDDGVPMCLLDSDTTSSGKDELAQLAHEFEASHRRRSTQSTAMNTNASSKSPSHIASNSSSRSRSNFSKLSTVLRTFFVICSSLSFISRCLIWFPGGRMSIIHSLMENPLAWTLRFYISTFHVALIIIELGLGLPIILPRGETLSILTQRGFVQSFLGVIDLIMHSNKSMAENISILQNLEGTLLSSARERRVQISFAIISVTSRGMMVVGFIYCLLGLLYDEYSGKKKKLSGINDK